jgi:hypothetical protein
MLIRILFLLTVFLGSMVLFTGVWTGSFAPTSRSPENAFIPQSITLDAAIVGAGIDAGQLLEKAAEKLTPQRMPWLKTQIRQTMTDAHTNFAAKGFLQRGPNHCARLEMVVFPGAATKPDEKHRLLVVSDGDVLAQVRHAPGMEPVLRVDPLLANEESVATHAAKEQFLNGRSCGGPGALLQEFHLHLQNGTLQTGVLQGTPVIQIKGDIPAEAMSKCMRTIIPVRHAYIYLDAKTLWPHRIEWWGADKKHPLRAILSIEFFEPELGCELSDEECMRTFSYRPNADAAP